MIDQLSMHGITNITYQKNIGLGYSALTLVMTNKEGNTFTLDCYGKNIKVINLDEELEDLS